MGHIAVSYCRKVFPDSPQGRNNIGKACQALSSTRVPQNAHELIENEGKRWNAAFNFSKTSTLRYTLALVCLSSLRAKFQAQCLQDTIVTRKHKL